MKSNSLQGGFKAVLWTDTLQLILMLVTMFTVFFKGNSDVGGFAAVINASTASGRIEFFECVFIPKYPATPSKICFRLKDSIRIPP